MVGYSARRPKKAMKSEKKPEKVTLFPEVEQTINSCRSLDYACDNKSIIYVPIIYAGQEKKSTLAKKHPFTSCLAAKHQNAAILVLLQPYKTNQWTVINKRHRQVSTFSSLNNFINLGSFKKVSVFVETIIPGCKRNNLHCYVS